MRLLSLFLLLMLSIPALAQSSLSQRIEALENEVLDLKLKSLNKPLLETSGSFNTVFIAHEYSGDTVYFNEDSYSSSNSQLFLNFNNTQKKQVKFYSTLGASYIWNNTLQGPDVVVDNGQENLRTSAMFVERAYLDYFFYKDYLSLSVGRLPTFHGPPMNFPVNSERLGTYPGLLYSLPVDGVATSFNWGNMLNAKDTFITRLIFTPLYNLQSNITQSHTAGAEAAFSGLNTTEGEALHLNIEYSGKNNLADTTLIFQGLVYNIGRPRGVANLRGLLQAQLGTNGVDRNVYELGSTDADLGTFESAVAHLSLEKILGSGLDLYTSLKYSRYTKKGNMEAVVTEVDGVSSGLLGISVGDIVNLGGFLYDQNEDGHSVLAGFRYNFSDRFSLGSEYINNSIGSSPVTIRTPLLLDYYQTIGITYHYFMNYQLLNKLNLTLGHLYAERRQEGLSFKFVDSDTRLRHFYLRLGYDF
jgi:hypothetical protein